MKVVLEISDKILNLVSGIAMMKTDSEEEEKKLSEVIERMKSSEEPTFIDIDKIDDEEVKAQLPFALALFAIGLEMEKNEVTPPKIKSNERVKIERTR